MLDLTGVKPEAVVCDLHPDLITSRFAESFGLPVLPVQHHLAHVAAVAAEHRAAGPVLGVALDGHGYGADGSAWGGEMIRLEGSDWRRIGHLSPLPLPGGDRAAIQPWRMGLAALHVLGRMDSRFADQPLGRDLMRMIPQLSMPPTTSLGRVFDAAAALLGVCLAQSYEGQAAMELEALVRRPQSLENGFAVHDGVLNLLPLLGQVADLPPQIGADLFHGTLIVGLTAWIADAAQRHALSCVALGGGCLANRVLADGLVSSLSNLGLRVLLPTQVPAGDGGLSLGQAFMGRNLLCA